MTVEIDDIINRYAAEDQPKVQLQASPLLQKFRPPPNAEKRQKPEVPFKWTPKLIEELLTSRQEDRQIFLEEKNKAKLNQVWRKVILDFESRCGQAPNATQVKNKYQALQAISGKSGKSI